MKLDGCVALVTGAGSSHGIGRAFVEALRDRGAAKVYASDVDPEGVTDLARTLGPAVVPLALDVTDEDAVGRVAARCRDVTLLVSNAGVCFPAQLIGAPDLRAARREMEVNFWGMLSMCRAFAPVLAAAGGGGIVVISSVYGLVNYPYVGSYSVSKAASASMIQGIRAELGAQGTLVVGVYPGTVDTALSATNPAPDKTPPAALARAVLDAVESATEEVVYGEDARSVVERLAVDRRSVEREYAAKLHERLRAARGRA